MDPTEEVKDTTAADLGAMLDAGDDAVVTLVAGDTHLVAHRAVLAARSPVFSAKFRHDAVEEGGGQLAVPDVEGPVLRQLIAYLYTLQIPHLPGMALQLMAASDIYGMPILKAVCERQAAAQLTVETAAAAAVLAVRHSCSRLRLAAIDFIKSHTHEVMGTQGWEDAVNDQPEDLVEVSRLVSEPTTEASISHVPDSPSVESMDEATGTTATGLAVLLNDGDNAVVTLVAGDTRLVAHRAVLAARSPVFADKFRQDMPEATSDEFAVPDVEGAVLRQLLVYFYTLQAPQLPHMAPKLLAAADMYDLLTLKADCERQVAERLSVETAVAVAIVAVRHSCTGLMEAALDFIKAHIHEVMATQGWANAVHSQPDDFIEVSLLISELAAQAGELATADGGISQPGSEPNGATVSFVSEPAIADHGASQPSGAAATPDDVISHVSEPAAADHGASQPSGAAATPDDVVSHVRNIVGETGRTLIEVAKDGVLAEVQALLDAGADVATTDWTKWTALHHAAAMGHAKVVELLLTAGAGANTVDIYAETPLHASAKNGRAAVIRLLAAHEADPSTRDVHGRTPLHLAAYYGHTEAVEALLEAGADKTIADEDGRTPLDIAKQYDKQQLIDVLK